MKLNEIVNSSDWNDEIKDEFFKKLKRSHNDYNRGQNCILKALNICKGGGDLKEAFFLLDFVLENYSDDIFNLSRMYSVKGNIYENYLNDFENALQCYKEWKKLNSNLGGSEFLIVRAYLRNNELIADNEFLRLFSKYKSKLGNLPTRDYLFWMSVFSAVSYLKEGSSSDSKRMFRKALEIYEESSPTFLQRKFKKLRNVEDDINISKKELSMIKKFAKYSFVERIKDYIS